VFYGIYKYYVVDEDGERVEVEVAIKKIMRFQD